MKKRLNKVSVLSAVLMAGAIMGNAAVPAFAVANRAPTVPTFDKYLVMNRNANVPNATFTYSVSIPTTDEMKALANPEDTNGKNLTVRKGIGAPTASSTTFAAGDQTFDSAQKVRTNKGSTSYYDAEDDQVDGLGATKKYAKHTSTVDFSKVTFSEPGVYRYKITENDPMDETGKNLEKGITKDSTPRYLDVYVESEENGKTHISGYVFHTLNEAQKKGDENNLGLNNPDGKNKGFTNTYETKDLTLTKTVTGNQGFRDQYFKFHVDITDLDAGARLFLTGADSNTRTTYKAGDTVAYAYNAETGTRTNGQARFVATTGTIADITKVKADKDNINPNSNTTEEKNGEEADALGLAITADKNGHAAFDVYLKHNETLKINGLTSGAKYTVKEESLDYTASATKNGTGIELTHDTSTHTDVTKNVQTLAGDETVAFTNDREGVLPTGIYHNNKAAFNIMGIAAAGGAIAIVIKKHRKDQAHKISKE